MIAVSQLWTFFKVLVLHLSIEHVVWRFGIDARKKVGGARGVPNPEGKPQSENFLFRLGTPDPYETSAVLSQGVQS